VNLLASTLFLTCKSSNKYIYANGWDNCLPRNRPRPTNANMSSIFFLILFLIVFEKDVCQFDSCQIFISDSIEKNICQLSCQLRNFSKLKICFSSFLFLFLTSIANKLQILFSHKELTNDYNT